MSDPHETELDRVSRDIAEGEARCARQRAQIARMAAVGQDTADAESVLATFERTLDLLRQHRDLIQHAGRTA